MSLGRGYRFSQTIVKSSCLVTPMVLKLCIAPLNKALILGKTFDQKYNIKKTVLMFILKGEACHFLM